MTSKCPRCEKLVFFAEKVSSLGKNWHRFCLKCERCNKTLSPGGHAEHDGKPYCHKPCYGTLFGPKGVNIGGAGSYIYVTPPPTPVNKSLDSPSDGSPTTPWTPAQMSRQQPKAAPMYVKTFAGETSHCPGCGKVVYFVGWNKNQHTQGVPRTEFEKHCAGTCHSRCGSGNVATQQIPSYCKAEKVMSLGRNWHRPCLRCDRCKKTLTSGGHAEHDGRPYCHVPCYGYLFGPKGVNIGEVGCYIYDKDSEQNEITSQS